MMKEFEGQAELPLLFLAEGVFLYGKETIGVRRDIPTIGPTLNVPPEVRQTVKTLFAVR